MSRCYPNRRGNVAPVPAPNPAPGPVPNPPAPAPAPPRPRRDPAFVQLLTKAVEHANQNQRASGARHTFYRTWGADPVTIDNDRMNRKL